MVELTRVIKRNVKVKDKKYSSMFTSIPKRIRESLKLEKGDSLSWDKKENHVEVRKHE